MEREEERIEFNRVIDALEVQPIAVIRLLESDRVKEIRIDYKREDNRYNRSNFEISLASRGPGIEIMSTLLPTIVTELDLAIEMGVEIRSASDNMDEDYVRVISNLEKFRNDIRSKSQHINEVRLTTYRRTLFRNRTLFVNPREADHYLKEVLSEIE